ncbi:hypothetical protein, partial [Klebsiella michiganensis]|uniref:hypothetical protein n=1 Tax=Klebsiella michiganensis TaxID=1134687 RepID=UPI001CA37A26
KALEIPHSPEKKPVSCLTDWHYSAAGLFFGYFFLFDTLLLWGGDRLCMDGSSPRKQREALRDKAWGRTSRICTAGRKMRFFYDLCDEFCTILDC